MNKSFLLSPWFLMFAKVLFVEITGTAAVNHGPLLSDLHPREIIHTTVLTTACAVR